MKKSITIIIATLLIITMSAPALAADYSFDAKDTTGYYKSTDYTDIYAAQYNYGGVNVIDFENRGVLPGLYMPTPQDSTYIENTYDYTIPDYTQDYEPDDNFIVNTVNTSAFTTASSLVRADGSIGTLEIPSLKLSVKAYEGTGTDSMAKGLGHFVETTAWDGNISLAGHNRGAKYTIGTIKDLKIGDTIKYTTNLGTRTYAVSFVKTIANNDWTCTAATSDNRITLITCLANQPNYRVCVQAIQVK